MQAHRHLQATPMVIAGAALAALFLTDAAHAQGRSCEQLRDDVAARIALPKDSFQLDIALKDATTAGKTMGTCEMGARKIVFNNAPASDAATSTTTLAQTPAPAVPTPAAPAVVPVAPAPAAAATTHVVPDVSTPAPQTRPVTRRGGLDETTWNQYKTWVSEARALHPYRDLEDRMLKVMDCESGGNARIVSPNGLHHGLFQYMVGTWKGSWNTYRDAPLTDARAQIFATSLAWSKGMAGHWGCYKRAH